MVNIRRMTIVVLVLIGIVWVSSGCVSINNYKKMEKKYKTKINSLENQRQALATAQRNLEMENQKMALDLGASKAENAKLRRLIRAEQETRARLKESLVGNLIHIPGVTRTKEGDLEIQGEVLFDPGKAVLKESGKDILSQVAEVLKQHPGNIIRIEGHTDTDPISQSKHKWTTGSNFELGAYRALKVLLYLEEQGVDPAKMYLCSFGEYSPKGDSKSENRRVIIGFVPFTLDDSGSDNGMSK